MWNLDLKKKSTLWEDCLGDQSQWLGEVKGEGKCVNMKKMFHMTVWKWNSDTCQKLFKKRKRG